MAAVEDDGDVVTLLVAEFLEKDGDLSIADVTDDTVLRARTPVCRAQGFDGVLGVVKKTVSVVASTVAGIVNNDIVATADVGIVAKMPV